MSNANLLAVNLAFIRKTLVTFSHIYTCDITYSTKKSLCQLLSICVEKPTGSFFFFLTSLLEYNCFTMVC